MEFSEFELYGPWDEGAKRRLVGIVAHCSKGRFLMQLRDDFEEVAGRGQWSLFGGHVDDGEDIWQAIIREAQEELGLKLMPDDLEALVRYQHEEPNAHVFIFKIKRPIEPHEICLGEGAGFAFLTRRQVLNFPVVNSVRDFVHGYVRSNEIKHKNT